MIESNNSRQIKYLHRLRDNSRFRREEKAFLVEGWKMTDEAVRHGLVKKVYIREGHEREWEKRIDGAFSKTEVVKKNLFDRICDTMTPQGVMAVADMPSYCFEEFLSPGRRRFLCLEDIRDPGNLGTMMRTAEGAGITGIILSGNSVDIFNPKVVRSTMGSLFRVPYFYAPDFIETMGRLRDSGVTLYAAHLQGSVPYHEITYGEAVGFLIGNEARGLSESAVEAADFAVRIPMEGELESLNAAVSAAILMYESVRNGG